MLNQTLKNLWITTCALGLFLAAGCAQLHLPAIDPSGERIFLPRTTTVLPSSDCALLSPRPAFVEPPAVPICGTPQAAMPQPVIGAPQIAAPQAVIAAPPTMQAAPISVPISTNQLTVTPGRLIAPIGTEVILHAGLEGAGRSQSGQRIEWTLTQDSVGHIAEVGGALRPTLFGGRLPGETKRSNDYAVTSTSNRPQVVTRGTPSTNDDVLLPAGRSWISVTSPTEGTTHVSVMAPEAAEWNRRRQTAAIHWLDAQWELPAQAVIPAGQEHQMVTKVTRASNGSPIKDWLVQYEILNPDTNIVTGQSDVVQTVRTNADGIAQMPIKLRDRNPGTANVHVKIIRPASKSGDLPKLVVGQGFTSVTWQAAALNVDVQGPATAVANGRVTYQIQVSNPGDMPTSEVTLRCTVPQNMRVINTSQEGRQTGNLITWTYPSLAAHSTAQPIEVLVEAFQPGRQSILVEAVSGDLRREKRVDTTVMQNALSVAIDTPATAEAGKDIESRYIVRNLGTETLTGLVVEVQLGKGLVERRGNTQLRRQLPDLPAGQQIDSFGLFLQANEGGTLSQSVQVSANGGHYAEDTKQINVELPPALFTLQMNGPPQATVGQKVTYDAVIRNPGVTPLTDIQIALDHSDSLDVNFATENYKRDQNGRFTWFVPRLGSGQRTTIQIVGIAKQVNPAALQRISVSTAENVSDTGEVTTNFVAAPQIPRNNGNTLDNGSQAGNNPPASVTNKLIVTMAEFGDPVRIGNTTKYIVTIKNDRVQPDRNVAIRLLFPPGLDFDSIQDQAWQISGTSQDRKTIDLATQNQVRAGETLPPIHLLVKATQVGKHLMQVQVDSTGTAEPIVVSEETTVVQ